MAIEISPKVISLTASGLIRQYRCVKMNSDLTVEECDATTDIVVGIAQEGCTAAQATAGISVPIAVNGVSKIEAGGSLSVGTWVGTANDGQATAAVGGTADNVHAIGMMLDSPGEAAAVGTCLISRTYFIKDDS